MPNGLRRERYWKRSRSRNETPTALLALASVETSLGEWKAARAHLEQAHQMVTGWDEPEGDDLAPARHDRSQGGGLRVGAGRSSPLPADRAGDRRPERARRRPGTNSPRSTSTRGIRAAASAGEVRHGSCRSSRRSATASTARRDAPGTQLATIDLNRGTTTVVDREKFVPGAAADQPGVGDRAGEAATWHQLASMSFNEGSISALR